MTTQGSSKKILHTARKKLVKAEAIKEILENASNSSRRIGALPFNVLKSIPESDRANVTMRVDEVFAEFARSVAQKSLSCEIQGVGNTNHNLYPLDGNKLKAACVSDVAVLAQTLKEILGTDDIDVSYLDHGLYKMVFKIRIGKEINVLSVFRPKYDPLFSKNQHSFHVEPQNIFTAYKQYSHGRVARPFMARVSDGGEYDGEYILSKFIDKDHSVKKSRRQFSTLRDTLKNSDAEDGNNTINGIIIEAGGFYYNAGAEISDPRIRVAYQRIADEISNILKFVPDYEECTDDFFYKDFYDIYEKYPDDLFDTTKWPNFLSKMSSPEFRASEKKQLFRNLARLKRIKNEFEKAGIWSQIKELLTQDIEDMFPLHRYNEFNLCYRVPLIRVILDIPVPELDLERLSYVYTPAGKRAPCAHHYRGGRFELSKYYTLDDINRLIEANSGVCGIDWSELLTEFFDVNHEKGTRKENQFYNRIMAQYPEYDWSGLRCRMEEKKQYKKRQFERGIKKMRKKLEKMVKRVKRVFER